MKRNSKKYFTLVEMMVAVAIMAVVFFIFYTIYNNIHRSHMVIKWQTRTDRELTKAFNDLNIDMKKASYPSKLIAGQLIVNPDDAGRPTDPLPQQRFRYLITGTSMSDGSSIGIQDSNLRAASHIEASQAAEGQLGEGTIIAQWMIHTPMINDENLKYMICTLRLYKELKESRAGHAWGALTYQREAFGNMSLDKMKKKAFDGYTSELPETLIMANVEWIELWHKRKYTQDEINKMNTIWPTGQQLLPGHDRDYFYGWMNPGSLNMKIQIKESVNISYVFHRFNKILGGSDRYFKKVSEFKVSPIGVAIEGVNSL